MNMYKQLISLTVGCGISMISWAGGDYASVSMQNAIQQSISTHPQVLGAKSREQASQQEVRAAWGGYLPRVDLTGAIGWERSDNPATRATERSHRDLTRKESNILLSQLLFDGWRVSNLVKQAKANNLTSRYQIAETQENLAFQASQAYLNVLRHRNLVSVAAKEVNAHKETVEKVRRRLVAGAGRKSELTLAESRLALTEARYKQAKGRLLDANDTYIQVVGVPVSSQLFIPNLPIIPNSLSQAQTIAMQINPSIAAVEAEYAGHQAAVGVAKSNFYPRITADLSYGYNENLDGVKGHSEDINALIRGSYNIYHGGSDLAATRSAVFRKQDTQYAIEDIRRMVREEVALAWNGLMTAKNRLTDLRSHRDKSKEVLIAYRKQFKLGQRTLFDLLNAEIEYYDAWEGFIDGEFNVRVQTYRLLSSMGTLVPKLFGGYENVILQTAPSATKHLVIKHSVVVKEVKKVEQPYVTVTQKTTVAAVPAARTVNTKLHRGYTIQLISAHTPQTLDKIITRYNLGKEARYYTSNVHGQQWYRLIYGDYPTYDAALKAKAQLPSDLQQMQPMVRLL